MLIYTERGCGNTLLTAQSPQPPLEGSASPKGVKDWRSHSAQRVPTVDQEETHVADFATAPIADIPAIADIQHRFVPARGGTRHSFLRAVGSPHVTRFPRPPALSVDSLSNNSLNNSTCVVLIVNDEDPDEHLAMLDNILDYTGANWNVQYVQLSKTYYAAEHFCERVRGSGRQLYMSHAPEYQSSNKWKMYDAVLKSSKFWGSIHGEHVLLTQPDAVLCDTTLDNFLDYDYVGAPWSHQPLGMFVGNGGLSLRRRETMIWCIKNYKQFRMMNEDIFFASCVAKNGKLPTLDKAKSFAIESMFSEAPFGIHKIFWEPIEESLGQNRTDIVKPLCRHCRDLSKPEFFRVTRIDCSSL